MQYSTASFLSLPSAAVYLSTGGKRDVEQFVSPSFSFRGWRGIFLALGDSRSGRYVLFCFCFGAKKMRMVGCQELVLVCVLVLWTELVREVEDVFQDSELKSIFQVFVESRSVRFTTSLRMLFCCGCSFRKVESRMTSSDVRTESTSGNNTCAFFSLTNATAYRVASGVKITDVGRATTIGSSIFRQFPKLLSQLVRAGTFKAIAVLVHLQ